MVPKKKKHKKGERLPKPQKHDYVDEEDLHLIAENKAKKKRLKRVISEEEDVIDSAEKD